jgi:hypothetical protein
MKSRLLSSQRNAKAVRHGLSIKAFDIAEDIDFSIEGGQITKDRRYAFLEFSLFGLLVDCGTGGRLDTFGEKLGETDYWSLSFSLLEPSACAATDLNEPGLEGLLVSKGV